MNCFYHKEKEGNLFCSYCGKALCDHCVKEYKGKVICGDCLESKKIETNSAVHDKSSKFWTFIFSLVPGAGHMYLGLMKRGLQMMLIFVGTIIFSSLSSRLNILLLLLAVEWFYSFFDCHHYKNKIHMGELVIDEEIIKSVVINKINKYHIGILLLGLGTVLILDQFFHVIRLITGSYIFANILRDLVFPVILIVSGSMILYKYKGGRLKETENAEEVEELEETEKTEEIQEAE